MLVWKISLPSPAAVHPHRICSWTGRGGRLTASCDLRRTPAPRRRRARYARRRLLKIVGQSHILYYVCSFEAVPWGERHEHRLQPIALGNGPGCSAQPPPFESPLRGLLAPEAWARTRASSCSNHLKTLKMAMGRAL